MNFIEKKTIHDKLLGVTHLEVDIALLRKVAPGDKILSRPLMNPKRDASEVLWSLLDHVSAEDVLINRRKNYPVEEVVAEAPVEEVVVEVPVEEVVAEAPVEEVVAEAPEKKSSSKSKNTPK